MQATPRKFPIEPKVKWGAIGAYLSGVALLALVNAVTGNNNQLLIEALPDVVEPFVLPLVPTLVGLAVAYNARHQYRGGDVAPPSDPDVTFGDPPR